MLIPPDKFHKDDIIIYCNAYNNIFPIKDIKPDIVLEDLSKKLCEDESLYGTEFGHVMTDECMDLVT